MHAFVGGIDATLFQPTLLAFTRSDFDVLSCVAGELLFQPTLLAFTRSDM